MDVYSIFSKIVNNGIVQGLFIALIIGLFVNRFKVRPRIYIEYKVANNGYGGNPPHADYTIRIILKNNSGYNAFNMKFFLISDNIMAFNETNINDNFLGKHSHIESLKEKKIELSHTIRIPFNDYYRIENKDGVEINRWLRHNDPCTFFKPETLNNVKAYLSYENERGKTFYSVLGPKNDSYVSKPVFFKPYILERAIKYLRS